MKRLLLSICTCYVFLTANGQGQFEGAFRAINDEVQNQSQAYQNLKSASEKIGHRLTGSQNGVLAEEMAYKLLQSYGFDVRYQPFEVESWNREKLLLEIGSSTTTLSPFRAVTLAHSPVSANVTAELIDVGNGVDEDYISRKREIKGKIALIYIGTLPGSPAGTISLHRSEKTALAAKYGAVGVIIINKVDGGVLLTGTASVTGKLIDIPAVCIGLEDGLNLKNKLKYGSQFAKIEMTNFSGIIKARNIIATWKGTALPLEKIVIGGHLDSWDLATGAIDNGIGSFSVIDIARTFKKLNLQSKRTLEFILFMGEEQGLLGSKAYVEQAIKDKTLRQVRFMLNYDMTNDPKGFTTTRKEMKPLFTNWGATISSIDSAFKNLFHAGASLHSDHQPFMLAGIPIAGGFGGKLPNNSGRFYHSDGDDFHLVDEQGMKNTVRFSAMLIYALANSQLIPVKKFTDSELAYFLKSENLEEPLKLAGEWKWKE